MNSHNILNNDFIDIKSKEQLNYFVDDEEIMLYYFGDFTPGYHYRCPFKPESQPSFHIYYYNGQLRWTRFGLFENRPHNAVHFVMKMYGLNWFEAMNKIHTDIVLNNKRADKKKIQEIKKRSDRDKPSMRFRYIPSWSETTLSYWKDYHITESTLRKHNVWPCKELWIGNRRFHFYSKSDPFYVFIHNMEREIFTCYRPTPPKQEQGKKSLKFRKNNVTNHVMGLEHCKGGDIGFITSSQKDIMCLDEIMLDSIAPHTESGWRYAAFLNAIVQMKELYKHVYVAFDSDDTGVKESIKMTKQFGLNYWNVPKSIEGTDPADAAKHHGQDFVIKSIHDKLKRDGIRVDNNFKIIK